MVPQFTSLEEFLKFLAGPGAAVTVILLMSYFAEDWSWFQNLKPKQKQLMVLVVSISMGVVGLFLSMLYTTAAPETKGFLNQLFLLIYTVGGFVLVPPTFHALVNKPLRAVQPVSLDTPPIGEGENVRGMSRDDKAKVEAEQYGLPPNTMLLKSDIPSAELHNEIPGQSELHATANRPPNG